MKKSAIARIIIWSLVAVLLASLLIVGINCTPSSFFSGDWNFGVTGISYKNSALYNTGGGEVTETFNGVDIEWTNGSVNIETYDGENTVISETETANDTDKLRWRVEDGVLKIHPMAAGMRYGFTKIPTKSLSVKIPVTIADKLNALSVDSTYSEISINGITVSDKIEIETVSGGATLENIKAKKLGIDTVSGNIKADGEITELESESVSGDITVSTSLPLKKLKCDSTSGDITVALPENSGFTLETDSVSGDINCELPAVSEKKNRRIYGDGSGKFKTDTVSGDLFIKAVR